MGHESFWRLPYASRRSPVLARNVVATSQPLAVQAGIHILRRGGSAVDAALAMATTLAVVEPTSNGLGSDAQAVVWDGKALHALSGTGRSPAAWTRERFAGRRVMPKRGWDSVTVPGAVSVWRALHDRFGRLPFADLFEDAIRHARDGFPVSPITAQAWARADAELFAVPSFSAAFFPEGVAPTPGQIFKFSDQAKTLASIAQTKGESFYRGALADAIAEYARKTGGALTKGDLERHEARWVDCLGIDFRGSGPAPVRLCELPPSTQGLAASLALGIAERAGIGRCDPNGPQWYHVQIEAMKLALRDAYAEIADPAAMRIDAAELLAVPRLTELAQRIDSTRASAIRPAAPPQGGTVYLCTADESGMMVSLIQSNFWGFGSGIVVPGTGISLQNRGYGFSLDEGHPNVVAGGKLPFHTIIPGFATCGKDALMAFGVMGGSMQAQGHLQMMLRIVGAGENPQAASDAPRWRLEEDGSLLLEDGFPDDVAASLRQRGHRIASASATAFGGAQIIQRLESGVYLAASDHRKDGHAAGY
jgi:gamma-glutamyltranspeptidase/glutathione hydrolase